MSILPSWHRLQLLRLLRSCSWTWTWTWTWTNLLPDILLLALGHGATQGPPTICPDTASATMIGCPVLSTPFPVWRPFWSMMPGDSSTVITCNAAMHHQRLSHMLNGVLRLMLLEGMADDSHLSVICSVQTAISSACQQLAMTLLIQHSHFRSKYLHVKADPVLLPYKLRMEAQQVLIATSRHRLPVNDICSRTTTSNVPPTLRHVKESKISAKPFHTSSVETRVARRPSAQACGSHTAANTINASSTMLKKEIHGLLSSMNSLQNRCASSTSISLAITGKSNSMLVLERQSSTSRRLAICTTRESTRSTTNR